MPAPVLQTLHEWLHVTMQHSMQHSMRYAKENNFSFAQLNAIFRISNKGPCGVSDFGEEMGISSAAASQLLDRLVQQGLATRAEDPLDRRNKRFTLTEAGEQVVRQSLEARQGWLTRLVELLSPAEQEQIEAALKLLIEKTASLESDQKP